MLMKYIPVFKGFDFFPHDLNLPFMKFKGPALAASIIAMLGSLILCMTYGLNYGVDFKGGSLIELQTIDQNLGEPGTQAWQGSAQGQRDHLARRRAKNGHALRGRYGQ